MNTLSTNWIYVTHYLDVYITRFCALPVICIFYIYILSTYKMIYNFISIV